MSDLNHNHMQDDPLLKLFNEDGYFTRLKKMFTGLAKPRSSLEYKEAMIEVQRLGAPAAAIFIPIAVCLLLIIMAAQTTEREITVSTEIMETQNLPDVEPPPPPEPPTPDETLPDIELEVANIDLPPTTATVQSPKPREFDSVREVQSTLVMPGIMASRDPGTRGANIGRVGYGDKYTEAAVMAALRHLKQKQQPDGSWEPAGGGGYKSRPAAVSFALLTYLAHGETPSSPEFGDTVRKAIEFLLKSQEGNGRFKGRDGHDYTHPIAIYALSEAYSMTTQPQIKEALEKALPILIKGQNPNGSWDYNMNAKSTRNDLSYAGWCVQALKAAKIAGMHTPGLVDAMKKAIRGLEANYNEKEGFFEYTGPNKSGRIGMTPIGSLCLQFLGQADSPKVKKSHEFMAAWLPTFDSTGIGGSPQYYCYYATQSKFFLGTSDRRWLLWNDTMKKVYLPALKDGAPGYKDHNGKPQKTGFWTNNDNPGLWGNDQKDKVVPTCFVALQLMVYYRFLPTTQADNVLTANDFAPPPVVDTTSGSEVKISLPDEL